MPFKFYESPKGSSTLKGKTYYPVSYTIKTTTSSQRRGASESLTHLAWGFAHQPHLLFPKCTALWPPRALPLALRHSLALRRPRHCRPSEQLGSSCLASLHSPLRVTAGLAKESSSAHWGSSPSSGSASTAIDSRHSALHTAVQTQGPGQALGLTGLLNRLCSRIMPPSTESLRGRNGVSSLHPAAWGPTACHGEDKAHARYATNGSPHARDRPAVCPADRDC